MLNRFFMKIIDRMSKGSFLIWMVIFITGCATPLTTSTVGSSQPNAAASSATTSTITRAPEVVETMPPLTKSPPNTAFVLGDCQQAVPPAGPAGAANPGDAGSKPALPSDPVQGLQQALQLANQEMAAAAQSTSLNDARSHAEAVVNILVGYWGCWYGDADGNGVVNDPSNGYGVLPAGRVQSAAPDTRAVQVQIGWALRVYAQGDTNAQEQVRIILGDVKQWQNEPMAAYQQIQNVVQNSNVNQPQVGKLDGQAVQAVAWARLILIKAQTSEQARGFAENGLKNTAEALQVARQIG